MPQYATHSHVMVGVLYCTCTCIHSSLFCLLLVVCCHNTHRLAEAAQAVLTLQRDAAAADADAAAARAEAALEELHQESDALVGTAAEEKAALEAALVDVKAELLTLQTAAEASTAAAATADDRIAALLAERANAAVAADEAAAALEQLQKELNFAADNTTALVTELAEYKTALEAALTESSAALAAKDR
jgi:chromosome segregation ATPase